ncbi:MAG: cation transporter [Capsulimonas sp.]|uniref:heavy-metal-associated domain-containing protein n=1 Tax=Capsulimonas sp. TaxID=2494211 RepID=UPI003265F1DD
METQTLNIEGMSCDACVKHVTNALRGVSGVQTAQVNLQEKTAVVTFDPAAASIDQMMEAVAEEGYTASPIDLVAVDQAASDGEAQEKSQSSCCSN